MTDELPQLEIVLDYAKKTVGHFIHQFAKKLPNELKEEIEQDAYLRTYQAFKKFNANQGWKSFVQLHCRGAVLDYIKLGRGSLESSLKNERTFGFNTRIELFKNTDDDSIASCEDTAGAFGIYFDPDMTDEKFSPKWELLEKMAPAEMTNAGELAEGLHIVSKVLLGFTQEQIAEQLADERGKTISRERVSQRVYEFFDELDSPMNLTEPWVNQCIYALGLSAHYHMKEHDNGIGWDMKSFDLRSEDSFRQARKWYKGKKVGEQLSLFEQPQVRLAM